MMGLGPRKFGGCVRLVPQAFALVRQYLWERHGAGSHWWLYRPCGCGLSLRSGPCGHCSLSEAVVCVCVCVKTPRNTVSTLPNSHIELFKQGGSESHSIHCPTKTVVWDCDIFEGRLEDVPANFELFELFTSCCNTVFPSEFPSNFRRTISDHVDHDLYFDELPFGPSRTMLIFPCYVNRGLWDNLALLRTLPDKHVELSSVCVSPPGATSSRLDGPSEKVQVR